MESEKAAHNMSSQARFKKMFPKTHLCNENQIAGLNQVTVLEGKERRRRISLNVEKCSSESCDYFRKTSCVLVTLLLNKYAKCCRRDTINNIQNRIDISVHIQQEYFRIIIRAFIIELFDYCVVNVEYIQVLCIYINSLFDTQSLGQQRPQVKHGTSCSRSQHRTFLNKVVWTQNTDTLNLWA